MAPEIALRALAERGPEPLTVLDPMCGSGTVLAVALQNGHNAIGVDIDPLAVMMSQLAVTAISTERLQTAAAEVVATAGRRGGETPWGEDEETDMFVDYWFGGEQKKQLIALASAVTSLDEPDQQLALRLAISRIIVTKSPQASLAADTAHSRPHRVQTGSDYDVLDGFARSAGQLARRLKQRTLAGSGSAELGDARELGSVTEGAADIAITSPPYLNALDYLRGHKLALVWFGYTISDLRMRRSTSIGAERGPGTKDAATEEVTRIVDLIEAEAENRAELKRPMLERFAGDCVGFAKQLRRTVKADGKAVLVVGNSTLRGNYIRNDLIVREAMEHAGFSLSARYERAIPPSSRYMAISTQNANSRITKRMRKEVVLTMGA